MYSMDQGCLVGGIVVGGRRAGLGAGARDGDGVERGAERVEDVDLCGFNEGECWSGEGESGMMISRSEVICLESVSVSVSFSCSASSSFSYCSSEAGENGSASWSVERWRAWIAGGCAVVGMCVGAGVSPEESTCCSLSLMLVGVRSCSASSARCSASMASVISTDSVRSLSGGGDVGGGISLV